jgi:hypothetical protein
MATVQKLDLRRDHWSGLKPAARLLKAQVHEKNARKVQDLLSIEMHASLDLTVRQSHTEQLEDLIRHTYNEP